jgi:hypothetical protein
MNPTFLQNNVRQLLPPSVCACRFSFIIVEQTLTCCRRLHNLAAASQQNLSFHELFFAPVPPPPPHHRHHHRHYHHHHHYHLPPTIFTRLQTRTSKLQSQIASYQRNADAASQDAAKAARTITKLKLQLEKEKASPATSAVVAANDTASMVGTDAHGVATLSGKSTEKVAESERLIEYRRECQSLRQKLKLVSDRLVTPTRSFRLRLQHHSSQRYLLLAADAAPPRLVHSAKGGAVLHCACCSLGVLGCCCCICSMVLPCCKRLWPPAPPLSDKRQLFTGTECAFQRDWKRSASGAGAGR